MDIGKRIRKLRKEKNWTLKELNKRTGLSISFLSDIERGISNPSLKRLKILAEELNVPISFLLGEEDFAYNQNNKSVPVLYTLKNNTCTMSERDNREYHTIDLSQNKELDNYFFINIQDDSMEGSGIIPGSLLLIRKQNRINNGEIAVVTFNNNDTFLVRKIYLNDNSIILQPENNTYETKIHPVKNVKIIGKVLSTRYYFEDTDNFSF